jgi:hypothetical protein
VILANFSELSSVADVVQFGQLKWSERQKLRVVVRVACVRWASTADISLMGQFQGSVPGI